MYTYLQEHHIRTGRGTVSVIVYGDQEKPALITYPDLALNREFCGTRCLGGVVLFVFYSLLPTDKGFVPNYVYV